LENLEKLANLLFIINPDRNKTESKYKVVLIPKVKNNSGYEKI